MTVPPAAHPDDLEQRLVRLEELAVFQDQTIAQLDEALARQRLEARMRILWLHFAETGGEHARPPHYASLD